MDLFTHHTAVLSNSIRLYKDSRFLLENNRFPSSFALAVLGIEELGKFARLIGIRTKPKLHSLLHLQKQTDIASSFLRLAWMTALSNFFRVNAYDYRGVPRASDMNSQLRNDLGPYFELDEQSMDLDIFSKLLETDPMPEALWLFSNVFGGGLNNLKNASLYVDASDDKLIVPDTAITQEMATRLVNAFEKIMSCLSRHFDQHKT